MGSGVWKGMGKYFDFEGFRVEVFGVGHVELEA